CPVFILSLDNASFLPHYSCTLHHRARCMSTASQTASTRSLPGRTSAVDGTFSESEAWRDVGAGWQPLVGSFHGAGYSIEWHDFFAKSEFDWAATFHPDCIELCLNLRGE